MGAEAIRVEPCETRRQLEQQRQELPLRESQQEQSEQQQQQHRVSPREFIVRPDSPAFMDAGSEQEAMTKLSSRAGSAGRR